MTVLRAINKHGDTSSEATCTLLRLRHCCAGGSGEGSGKFRQGRGSPVGARGHVTAIRPEAKIIFASFLVSVSGSFRLFPASLPNERGSVFCESGTHCSTSSRVRKQTRKIGAPLIRPAYLRVLSLHRIRSASWSLPSRARELPLAARSPPFLAPDPAAAGRSWPRPPMSSREGDAALLALLDRPPRQGWPPRRALLAPRSPCARRRHARGSSGASCWRRRRAAPLPAEVARARAPHPNALALSDHAPPPVCGSGRDPVLRVWTRENGEEDNPRTVFPRLYSRSAGTVFFFTRCKRWVWLRKLPILRVRIRNLLETALHVRLPLEEA